jgi:enoyl-CoA hydratase
LGDAKPAFLARFSSIVIKHILCLYPGFLIFLVILVAGHSIAVLLLLRRSSFIRCSSIILFITFCCSRRSPISSTIFEATNPKRCHMYQTILTSLEDKILTITINRPDKLNALNRKLMEELNTVLDEVFSNNEIRSVIITGSGEKAFVAGADISEFLGLSVLEGTTLAESGQRLFKRMEHCPKPIVAAVNGFALGGGCELAMAFHFRVASDNAKFGQPEVNLGLIPGYGGTQRLVQLVGKGRALELMLTGNMIDANTALQYGLVNYVVPQQELLEKVKSILAVINTKAPIALAKCIEAASAVFDESRNGYDVEVRAFGHCFETEDMKEGASAFLEKRKAVFTGK